MADLTVLTVLHHHRHGVSYHTVPAPVEEVTDALAQDTLLESYDPEDEFEFLEWETTDLKVPEGEADSARVLTILHHHRHGVSWRTVLAPEDEDLDDIDVAEFLEEDYEPSEEEYLKWDIRDIPLAPQRMQAGSHVAPAMKPR